MVLLATTRWQKRPSYSRCLWANRLMLWFSTQKCIIASSQKQAIINQWSQEHLLSWARKQTFFFHTMFFWGFFSLCLLRMWTVVFLLICFNCNGCFILRNNEHNSNKSNTKGNSHDENASRSQFVQRIHEPLVRFSGAWVWKNMTRAFSSLSLPCKVDNFAAAVQSGGSRGARLRRAAGYNTVRLYRRPWHLQRRLHALGAATNHHRTDAPRTHAPAGEPEHFHSEALPTWHKSTAIKDTEWKAKYLS